MRRNTGRSRSQRHGRSKQPIVRVVHDDPTRLAALQKWLNARMNPYDRSRVELLTPRQASGKLPSSVRLLISDNWMGDDEQAGLRLLESAPGIVGALWSGSAVVPSLGLGERLVAGQRGFSLADEEVPSLLLRFLELARRSSTSLRSSPRELARALSDSSPRESWMARELLDGLEQLERALRPVWTKDIRSRKSSGPSREATGLLRQAWSGRRRLLQLAANLPLPALDTGTAVRALIPDGLGEPFFDRLELSAAESAAWLLGLKAVKLPERLAPEGNLPSLEQAWGLVLTTLRAQLQPQPSAEPGLFRQSPDPALLIIHDGSNPALAFAERAQSLAPSRVRHPKNLRLRDLAGITRALVCFEAALLPSARFPRGPLWLWWLRDFAGFSGPVAAWSPGAFLSCIHPEASWLGPGEVHALRGKDTFAMLSAWLAAPAVPGPPHIAGEPPGGKPLWRELASIDAAGLLADPRHRVSNTLSFLTTLLDGAVPEGESAASAASRLADRLLDGFLSERLRVVQRRLGSDCPEALLDAVALAVDLESATETRQRSSPQELLTALSPIGAALDKAAAVLPKEEP